MAPAATLLPRATATPTKQNTLQSWQIGILQQQLSFRHLVSTPCRHITRWRVVFQPIFFQNNSTDAAAKVDGSS
jgi:hypothetical protein